MNRDTIVAQCTPQGAGAIALIRISGPNALIISARCAQTARNISITKLPSHTIHFGWITDEYGSKIDQVLFLLMHAPATFTGHDTIEITCHNNQFIIQAIIDRLIACGARLAAGGEFTRQAIENDKLDLLQAEAINELVHAQSIAATQTSMAQLEGSLSAKAASMEKQLLRALAFCEASFEFIDEEIDFTPQIKDICSSVCNDINTVLATAAQATHIRNGFRIAILGSVNAGKSSLFNALLGSSRAIVTDIAGTTRDVIEASIPMDGIFITLADTAGIRETSNMIEQQGIARSLQEAEKADLVLLVYNNSVVLSDDEQKIYERIQDIAARKLITIGSKADLPTEKNAICDYGVAISAKTGQGIQVLKDIIRAHVQKLHGTQSCPFLINQRHIHTFKTMQQQLQSILTELVQKTVQYELLAHELNQTVALFSDLTGKEVSEKTMNTIFQTFCVGK